MPPTSFGPVKQINAGVLDTGYVESGPGGRRRRRVLTGGSRSRA
jgi:hypothetical protein